MSIKIYVPESVCIYICTCRNTKMGNSGSAHNISSGRSGIDRTSQFQSQFKHLGHSSHHHSHSQSQLSRTGFRTSPINPQRNLNPQWRRSYQPPGFDKDSKAQAEVPFKVLPELDKKLNLRATTNGAILNSGGTISGRKPNENHTQSISNALSQRSKTFIIETARDGNRKNDQNSEFTRSQTLLYVKTKTRDSETNLSRMQRHTYSEPELINKLNQSKPTATKNVLESTSRPSNRNKYSKKRRAPEAPAAANPTTPIIKSNTEILRNPNPNPNLKPDHAKPIHFAKNSDRQLKLTKPSPVKPVQNRSDVFKRGNENRNSLGGNQHESTLIERPQFTYRREKSSDAIMLKSRKSENFELKIPVNMDNHQKYDDHSNIQKTAAPKGNVDDVIVSAQGNKTQRTFYFGMEMVGSADTTKTVTADENLASDEAQLPNILSYDMEYKNTSIPEESMNDNGLLVHIRPTLPRRQAETPSFSPTLAWRSLMEELDRVENSQMKESLNIWTGNSASERPIQPNRTTQQQVRQVSRSNQILNTWTPEQDLGEDNDDRAKGLSTDDDSSSDEYRSKWEGDGLLFYGSKMNKKSGQTVVSPIHTFSLSLPRDSHLQHNRGVDAGDVCIYKSLQKSKTEDFFNNNTGPSALSPRKSNPQSDPTDVSVTKFEGCNNWLLHKNVSEPQSIKFLTGGKHVMYLPGSNDQPNQMKPVQTEPQADVQPKLKANRHFKSRQRHIPQSLQDKTPIFPTTSIKEHSLKLEDEKPLHQRFSFNNPVRLLEKKLHTEKSVKAAKTKMSLEGELEALKKVEEDFQRNRANEKENIQHQLRLHFGTDNEQFEQYHSLPIAPVLDRFSAINLNESNSKLFSRDDPEGCVSNVPYTASENEEHNINFTTKIF
ncbi:uncharacterized protein LOC117781716 isoform X2 [Drosophila innubila]|uniref:uncharacterized protein LOC117781716 isoform X2 n=1 Tax=Drosophila innubila TaxID=198719 RepID=UPI00148BA8D7|nr:uncharacterized protein LOC117781716 isoform X2 [Drosophila innubila]